MRKNILLAIDGRCASGKTTVAEKMKHQSGYEVIHMDDFFLRPEQRTEERLATPGGNIDYERFIEEVIKPIEKGEKFSYRPYDCQTRSMKEPITINPDKNIIVEGVYSCHPKLWEYYDIHAFVDVEKEVQRERIMARNGEEGWERFENMWIPLEETYFSAYNIKERCEMIL